VTGSDFHFNSVPGLILFQSVTAALDLVPYTYSENSEVKGQISDTSEEFLIFRLHAAQSVMKMRCYSLNILCKISTYGVWHYDAILHLRHPKFFHIMNESSKRVPVDTSFHLSHHTLSKWIGCSKCVLNYYRN
jgi:hypothetical protein